MVIVWSQMSLLSIFFGGWRGGIGELGQGVRGLRTKVRVEPCHAMTTLLLRPHFCVPNELKSQSFYLLIFTTSSSNRGYINGVPLFF